MKIIIAGSREFICKYKVEEVLEKCLKMFGKNLHIITGGAKGPDTWAKEWCEDSQVDFSIIYYKSTYGKAGGPIRNRQMAKLGEILIAFWDGKSKGTKNMIEEAENIGLKVKIIY